MKRLYTATAPAFPDDPEREPYYFASLDGETWLGVNRLPTADDYDAVAALFEPRKHGKTTTLFIRAARRYIAGMPGVVFHEPIERPE